jgi:hypothetical protein
MWPTISPSRSSTSSTSAAPSARADTAAFGRDDEAGMVEAARRMAA